MTAEARRLSLADTLRLQLHVSVPTALLGVVMPRRWVLRIFVRLGLGTGAFAFLRRIRAKHGSGVLWTWFPPRRTLLLLDAAAARDVLGAPAAAPDPWLKKRVLSRFAPGALVITSGPATAARRSFNVDALGLRELRHPHAAAFVGIAGVEVDRLLRATPARLRFADFEDLAQRMTHQVVLGLGHVEPDLQRHFQRLLAWSNAGLRHVGAFRAFQRKLASLLETPSALGATSLGSVAAHAMHDRATDVSSQVTFWLYVMKDAIELHAARTLALLAAHREVQARVRRDIAAAGTLDAQGIGGLSLLEACILEQLRLWTPVPLLLRRMEDAGVVAGVARCRRDDQALVHAGFYHRDPAVFGPRADIFDPDAVVAGDGPPLFVFSVDPRDCAGRTLVLFLLKTTLALLLRDARYELAGPALERARIPCLYDHFAIDLRRIDDAPRAVDAASPP